MNWEMDGIIPNLVEYIQPWCQSRISSLDKSLTLQEWPQPASATPNSKCQKIHCCFPAAIVPGGTAHPCPRIWREPCQTWCKISNNDANKEFWPQMVHRYCNGHKPATTTLQNSQKIHRDFLLLAEGRIHELGNGWNHTKLGGIHPTIMPMKSFKLRQVIHIAIMATTCYCNP